MTAGIQIIVLAHVTTYKKFKLEMLEKTYRCLENRFNKLGSFKRFKAFLGTGIS